MLVIKQFGPVTYAMGTLQEILAGTGIAAKVRALPNDVAGCTLEMDADGLWTGNLGTLTQAQADALVAADVMGNVKVGTKATVSTIEYVWQGAAVGLVSVGGTTPESYFGSSIPVGWLSKMLADGITNISLLSSVYPFPATTDLRKISGYSKIYLRGSQLPTENAGKTALVGGSTIRGGLALDNCSDWEVSNIGFDRGADYMAIALTNAYAIDGCLVSSNHSRMNFHDCLALNQSLGDGMHGFLLQSASGYSQIDNLRTIYGTHGIAIKEKFTKAGFLRGDLCTNAVTIKSDTVAAGTGYVADGINLDTVKSNDCNTTLAIISGGASASGADTRNIVVGTLEGYFATFTSGLSRQVLAVSGQVGTTDQVTNVNVSRVISRNVNFALWADAIDYQGVSIGEIQAETAGIICSVKAQTVRPISIGKIIGANIGQILSLESNSSLIVGEMVSWYGVNTLVTFMGSACRLVLGAYSFDQASASVISATAHTYSNSCSDYAGNMNPFRLDLRGGSKCMDGDVTPGSSLAQSNYVVMTIPSYCRPKQTRTISVQSVQASGQVTLAATVSTAGAVTVLSMPASTIYLSFSANFK